MIEHNEFTLTESQKQVVYAKDGHIVILAGAGTGKTSTLVSKIAYQVTQLKIDPKSIVALTFTNAAGLELKTRYLDYCENKNEDVPFFGTFHSFCYDVLKNSKAVRSKLGYVNIPTIVDSNEESVFQSKAAMLSSTKLPKQAQSILYKPQPKEEFAFKVFHKTLDKLLIAQNKITFDRLCYRICTLFSKHDESIINYLHSIKVIYIDEFQDTDKLQWEFVKAFFNSSSIIVCGDIRQAIYQFRGADSSIIKTLIADPNWAVFKLEENFRSTIQICQYVNRFLENYRDSIPNLTLNSNKNGPAVRHTERSKFLSNLPKLIEEDANKTKAIICRTNKEVSYLCSYLNQFSVPYSMKYAEHKLNLVKCALDNNFKYDFYISCLNEYERSTFLRSLFLNEVEMNDLEARFYDTECKIQELYSDDNFNEIKALYDDGQLSLNQISESSLDDNSLYVGTIHSVKGLEFDSVYVFGVNSPSFNVLSCEELMNLYYVACTRAKTLLTIITD